MRATMREGHAAETAAAAAGESEVTAADTALRSASAESPPGEPSDVEMRMT